MILENGEIQFCLNACLLCRFNQKLVVLAQLIAQQQTLLIVP